MITMMMMTIIIIVIISGLRPMCALTSFELSSSHLCASASLQFLLLTVYSRRQAIRPAILLTRFSTIVFERDEVISLTPTASVEDQASIFMYPEERVARLYVQTPDSSDTS
jgi:hypothetical protein